MIEIAGWIALALLAGMLLNATPCVLPAVPIKLRILLAEGGQSPRRRLMTGLALLAGSLLFFGSLGALSVMLQWSWGAPMGQPVFRGLLAGALVVAAALLIFDIGRLPIPQRVAQWQGRGPAEGFVVGLAGGVLSLPCTGPFLGGVLAFSLAQSTTFSILLFLAIGLGMAAPYLVLLAFPQWAPRSGLGGRVGRAVNRLLGFGLLAGALYYGQEFLPALLQGRGSVVLLVLLLMLWTAGTWLGNAPWVERTTAATALVLALGLVSVAGSGTGPAGGLQWQPVSRAEARPGQVRGPALVEFTADWCINCKVLERTVYRSTNVARATGDTVSTLQLDLTDFDRDAQALLQSWGGTGLPYAVVVNRNGDVHARLRDLFGEDRLVRALEAVAAGD
mgnify:CR=1 FL=1